MSVQLTLVNEAFDLDRTAIVLFQRNRFAPSAQSQIVWHSIQYCGFGWNHPFDFSNTLRVSVTDAFGNFSPAQDACPGSGFEFQCLHAGTTVKAHPRLRPDQLITLTNRRLRGAIHANFVRNGKVVAQHRNLAPAQKAIFENDFELWVGLTKDDLGFDFVRTVDGIASPTKFSLRNIASADIIMRADPHSKHPVSFELTNINSG